MAPPIIAVKQKTDMASLFVDALSVIDFSYLDAQRGVVGESWIVDIEMSGDLNDEGMVFDFGHVKKAIKAEIDRGMDHAFVIPTGLPGLEVRRGDTTSSVRLHRPDTGFILDYQAPNEAYYWLDTEAVTPEAATRTIEQQVRAVVPDNVTDIRIHLRTESMGEQPYYHYSHGLKKHAGDCQRMIHGHRSRLVIERNGQRTTEQEAALAREWQDIYLVTAEDIVETRTVLDVLCYDMAYQAQQGDFSLTLPQARCAVLDTDTTVELIAQHILARVGSAEPEAQWTVRAFEGVDKGAIARQSAKTRTPN